MKNTLKSSLMIAAFFAAVTTTSCSSVGPAARYAKAHSHREFKSWDEQNKKIDREKKKPVKDHWKVRHTWDKNQK